MQDIRYTKEFVEDLYKQNGCELLEEFTGDYKKSLKYRCKCGVISSSKIYNFNHSPRCWDCAARNQSHSQEYVENIFKERGCELLDTYKNNRTRMKFKCKCGEISTITLASFNDKGCYCENCGGKKKLTVSYVRKEVSKFNYILVDGIYIAARVKLKLKCDKNHDCEISWNNFKKGKRCRTCFIEAKWHHPDDRKFVLRCRSLLRNCLRDIRVEKFGKTEQMLGYDGIQLKDHLTNHPNWIKLQNAKWHIDHIFPIKAFCDYGIKDTLLINCLENLRPLLGKENMSKCHKYNKEEFEEWLKSKGIVLDTLYGTNAITATII